MRTLTKGNALKQYAGNDNTLSQPIIKNKRNSNMIAIENIPEYKIDQLISLLKPHLEFLEEYRLNPNEIVLEVYEWHKKENLISDENESFEERLSSILKIKKTDEDDIDSLIKKLKYFNRTLFQRNFIENNNKQQRDGF